MSSVIPDDALADGKMAFISGPRQVGKTTLGKQLLEDQKNYFSWDQADTRKVWTRSPEKILEGIGVGPVLLDEIHKDRKWKSKIKGLYDTFGDQVSLLVTGSAKLDLYRKGGDSLLGRYIPYRLHPFSVAESERPPGPDSILQKFQVSHPWKDLLALGGYPEPLLAGSEKKAGRWSRLRLDRLAFEDTRDVKVLSDLNAFRAMLDLIPERVGSLFSFHALKEDVGVAYATVRGLGHAFRNFVLRIFHPSLVQKDQAQPPCHTKILPLRHPPNFPGGQIPPAGKPRGPAPTQGVPLLDRYRRGIF